MADQVVQQIVDWVAMVGPIGVYLIIALIAYLENVLPPIPGDVLLAFGGYLAAEGLVGITPIWLLTVFASVVGFMNMYWLGNKLENQISENRHDHFLLKFVNYRYIYKGKKWMGQYGQWVVVANRFLAGTRSVISLTAGMSHLSISKTVINALISSALWNAILLAGGWFVRDNWQIIGVYLSDYGKVILIGIGIVTFWKILAYQRAKKGEDKKTSKE